MVSAWLVLMLHALFFPLRLEGSDRSFPRALKPEEERRCLEKAAAGDAPASSEAVDEMLNKAIDLAVEAGQVSISMLQRRLRVGYARAGRLVDEMTLRGITAEAEGPTKPRTVLISREEWRRMQENQE